MSIRDRATGLFAWVIVVLLIIPFALWGIQEYLGGGSGVNVAVVNDLEISRNMLNRQVDGELRGKKDRPEGNALVLYRKQVLNRMIQEELIYQKAVDQGFRINEALIVMQIRSNTAFFVDGKFDQNRYEDLLRYNGLSPSGYQAKLARDMLTQQYVGSILKTSFVTPLEVDHLLEQQGRELNIAYMEVPFKKYQDAVQITDEQVSAYYNERKQNFMTPEKIKVDYLQLTTNDIESEIKYTEEQLLQYYNDNKDNFITPEQRRVAHILFEVTDDKNMGELVKAEEKANEVYAMLEKGEAFDQLAKKYSADAGSASLGGDIGALEEGTLDKAFEEVAVKLEKGKYSKPVKTAFGYHIIKVLDIKAGTNKSYDDVKTDIEANYKKQQAESLFYDRKEALYNQTYENPDSLEIASEALGIKIKTSGWFTRAGLPGDKIFSDAKVISAAFDEDVFAGGNVSRSLNSKLIEIKSKNKKSLGSVIVIRLSDYQPSQQQPLETVKAEIIKTLSAKAARKAMDADVESYLAHVRKNGSLESFAKDKSLSYKNPGFITRSDSKQDSLMLSAAFKAPKPEKEKTVYVSAHTLKGNAVIIGISGIKKGIVSKDDPARPFMSQFMQRMLSSGELTAFVEELKSQADIKFFESRLSNDET
ncbi:MAG: hypothetical protein GXP13_01645 [Gammaproteobacteria bacterium]|nr:hypothetical protein [Gammaproteobacteria bacterium]